MNHKYTNIFSPSRYQCHVSYKQQSFLNDDATFGNFGEMQLFQILASYVLQEITLGLIQF